ncbi:MAG: response regulator [Chloroflexi bacterium]|nr:response regulator [Chloroflexota bacterium]
MKRVLVVDDEIDTLDLLKTMLELVGYAAITTPDPAHALTLAETEKPDCALLDIMMPKLDGFTLCKMLRSQPATRNLPIVFLSAYQGSNLEARRLEAGADLLVPKPVGLNALVKAIDRAIAIRDQAQSAAQGS